MSRLDSVIRRLKAQRSCLNFVTEMIKDKEGVILELGLGNGRTFDHIRELLPAHEIYVFEREVNAHLDCIPDDEHLFLGDIKDTVAEAMVKLGRRAIMLHTDIGTGDLDRNAELAAWMSVTLEPFLLPGAVVISDSELSIAGSTRIDPPADVPQDRYFLYVMDH